MTVVIKSTVKGLAPGEEYTGPDERFLLESGYAGPVEGDEPFDNQNITGVDYEHDRDNPLSGDPIPTEDAELPAVDPGILLGSDRLGTKPEPEPVGPATPTGDGELLPAIDPATKLGAEGGYVVEQVEEIDPDYLAAQDEQVAADTVSEQETELSDGLEPHVANEPEGDEADDSFDDFDVDVPEPPTVTDPEVEPENEPQVQPADFHEHVSVNDEIPASDSAVDSPAEVAEDVESGEATVGGPSSTVSENPSL